MELGELGDEREPHPDTGVVHRRHRTVLEGLEDGLPVLLGDAGSVVLDRDQHVVALRRHLDPHLTPRRRVPRGVHQQVLHDPGDHLRIDPRRHRPRVDMDLTARHRLGIPDEERDEPPDGDLLELGLHDAAGETFRVEEVRHDRVQATGLRGETVDQLLALLLRDAEAIALLEGQGASEDRRKGGPDVVRHGGQEGRLDLVGPSHVLHRLPLEVERPCEVVVRLLGIGDVEHHALPVHGVALVVHLEDRLVADPHRPAVGGDQTVLAGVGLARLVALLPLQKDPLAIVGMEGLCPPLRVPGRDLRGIAEQLLDERADIGG